ncbi:MAG TPA: MerR family transcriptional regulator [Treponemataceae bacterium]|jgi:DNA-binding transcriptional MerR regulator|nr:MerR family transcriptional regulator [Treponemataceae bacterium]HOS29760.1 MerR family transcriptional regulator [Treponemataceae bacterium]HQL04892.1 MerR family transcriptional regulator [Treponemataceae bacterium]
MAEYSIGDVEELTGVKAHVLRYWEEVIPAITPQKLNGRRVYSKHDILIILRLKHLIQDKKFTIEGARNRIIEESSDDNTVIDQEGNYMHLHQSFNEFRSELIDLFFTVRNYRKHQE